MTKRTKFTVTGMRDDHVAKFSDYRHAMQFACDYSRHAFRLLIEVAGRDGFVGQYKSGRPTPEFKAHHDAEFVKYRGAACA